MQLWQWGYIANFVYNTITGNISTGTKPTYTIYVLYDLLINNNNIFSNTATDTDVYDLWNDNAVGSPNLNAENNWWGTNSEIDIQAKMYDYKDLSSKGLIDYTPWSPSINIDAPISAPAGLTAVSGTSGKILLSWADNPESDLSGYIVHWGTEPGNYTNSINVGNTTSYTITGLSKTTYYIALTAYDIYYSGDKDDPATIVNDNQTGGNESWYSDEKVIELTDGSKGDLELTASTLFGTAADETGRSVSVLGNTLYLGGVTSDNSNDGIAAKYLLPLSNNDVPLWNITWPALNGADEFYGIAASFRGVFLAGNSYNRTSDLSGGKENKGIVVRFPLTGATGDGFNGSIWDKQTPSAPGAFSYGGSETLSSITAANRDDGTIGRPCLRKYDTAGALKWSRKTTSLIGAYNGVRAFNGAIYAVGSTLDNWSAVAYNDSNVALGSVGEGMIASYGDIPMQTFTLGYTGIKHITFSANAHGFAGNQMPLMDNITFTATPEPISSILFIAGGILLGGRKFLSKKTQL